MEFQSLIPFCFLRFLFSLFQFRSTSLDIIVTFSVIYTHAFDHFAQKTQWYCCRRRRRRRRRRHQMCDNFLAEKEHFKDAVRKERDDEIQDIHKRVQSAIEKKDESLEVIIKENASLKDRCIKLEAIVRQQRKDYCIK